jgi:hypothetical protein
LLGNGDGSFQPSVQADATQESDFIVAHLGNPPRPYLVAAAVASLQIEQLQAPEEALGIVSTIPTGSQGALYVVSSDMNRDGLPDLLDIGGFGDIEVFLATDAGTWLPSGLVSGCGQWPMTNYVADFNEDGANDILVATLCGNAADSTPTPLAVFLGNGDGTFRDAGIGGITLGGQPTWLLGDLNEDGHVDVLAYSYIANSPHPYRVLLGRGDGTFSVGPSVALDSVNEPTPWILFDLDGDGHLDYVFTDGTAFVHIALGNGDGTFQPPTLLGVAGADGGAVANGAWVGDVDNDGLPDLVVNDTWDGDISIFLNCTSSSK